MLWFRRFIFIFPLAIIVFFLCAYLLVRSGKEVNENAMVQGSIGEPENINPIRATTTSASDVTGLVFNGLLTTDEQMGPKPSLAKSWDIDQTSRMFFNSEQDAQAVLESLQQAGPSIRIDQVAREGTTLNYSFSNSAGPGYQASLVNALKDHPPRPVWLITITPGAGGKFPDGGEVKPLDIFKRIESALKPADGDAVDAVLVNHYVVLDSQLEIVGHGPREAIEGVLKKLLATDDKEKALAEYAVEDFTAQDRPVYTFHLRDNVMWHDGEIGGKKYAPAKFTSADVVFTYESLVSPEVLSPRAADYVLVESVTAPDPLTVKVVYKKPYSVALNSWMMDILPAHVLKGKPIDWWGENFDRAPIGTGPFKFGYWKSGELIKLVRNDDYWEGRPNLDAVYIRYISEQLNIQLALETGGIDFYSVEPHAVKRFEDEGRFELFRFLSRGYSYIGWNLKRDIFKDKRVRRALAHAVNIDEIIEYKLYGHAEQSTGIYTPHFWFANPKVKLIEYDPEKAKALLAEAGWTDTDGDGFLDKDGKKFKFELITNNNEIRRDIGVIVQANLRKIGIDVELKIFEWSVFIDQYIDKQAFDACILGWRVGIDYDMYQLFHSSQADEDELNFCSYKNPEVDQLIEKIRVTFDREKLKEMCWKLQEIIYDDQPYLWLFVSEATVAMHRDRAGRSIMRVYRPADDGKWVEEPIRVVPAGMGLYMPFWYRTTFPPQAAPGKPALPAVGAKGGVQ